jgi:hypothetical protein
MVSGVYYGSIVVSYLDTNMDITRSRVLAGKVFYSDPYPYTHRSVSPKSCTNLFAFREEWLGSNRDVQHSRLPG